MGSQNFFFGDPRPLLYTSTPRYSRGQWFVGQAIILVGILWDCSGKWIGSLGYQKLKTQNILDCWRCCGNPLPETNGPNPWKSMWCLNYDKTNKMHNQCSSVFWIHIYRHLYTTNAKLYYMSPLCKDAFFLNRNTTSTTQNDRLLQHHWTTGCFQISSRHIKTQNPPRRQSLVPLQFHGDWYPWMLLLAWSHESSFMASQPNPM